MTTDELLTRVESRLNKTDNPPLPPEETMRAILELGRERDSSNNEKAGLYQEIAALKDRIEGALSQKEEAEFKQRQAEDRAKEQEWVAQELANFVKAVANRLFVGQEAAAAQRVYDLNGNSITKKRLKAYNFDSLDEAKKAYADFCLSSQTQKPYDADEFMDWLFRFA